MKVAEVYFVDVKKKTDKAVLLGIEGNNCIEYIWFPLSKLSKPYASQMKDGTFYNKHVYMPVWLARTNGLFAKNWNGTPVYDVTVFDSDKLDVDLDFC